MADLHVALIEITQSDFQLAFSHALSTLPIQKLELMKRSLVAVPDTQHDCAQSNTVDLMRISDGAQLLLHARAPNKQ